MFFEKFGWKHLIPLLNGLVVTLRVCALTLLFGTLLGVVVGIALCSNNRFVRSVCKVYVNLIRGIPLLVILFVVFYGIPLISDINIPQGMACLVSLTIYAGAYIAEIVRGSIQSIPKGQTEAAQALGMNSLQVMWIVIMPQAVKLLIPPLVGFFIALVKDSSLVSAIGYIDLTRAGKVVGNLTVNPLLSFTCVAIFYFIVCYSLSKFAQLCEKKLQNNAGEVKNTCP